MNKFTKKLKNFLITATIFATSISFATSVHAIRDPWQDSLSRATDQGNFATFENVYKNTDLVSDDDYKFARAIDQKNRSYLENNCANWKYDKYCQWNERAVAYQLLGTQHDIDDHLDNDFLNFLLEQGIITDAFSFRQLFTWAVFDGYCDSFVQNFHKRFPKTQIAPAGSVEGINTLGNFAYSLHKNDLISIECLTKLVRYIHPTTLLYALFRHAPAADTEKFAAAANFLLDKGATINNFISSITHLTIFQEALYNSHLDGAPFKVYFLLTHDVNINYCTKNSTMSPIERFHFRYAENCRDRKAGRTPLVPNRIPPAISYKEFGDLLKNEQFINHILDLYTKTEGHLPPYEQILSQYKFHDPAKNCCIM